MSTEHVAVGVIDVYTDTVPTPRQRARGQRPTPHPAPDGAHDFRTPPLATPVIQRPAVWPETAVSRDEILHRAEALEAATGKELRRRVAGVRLLLDWLEPFPGATWQQRWLASGADGAGESWADAVNVDGLLDGANGRAQLTGAARRMVLLGALRPAYNWLYHLRSGPVLERFRTLHDPDGFAALDPICDATPRFTVLDRRSAYHQLTRILMHNGGRLADITLADCIEAYRAQIGYSARQHSHWYLLLRQSRSCPPTVRPASGRRRGGAS